MKIEITHYGNKAIYEFATEHVNLYEDFLPAIEGLIKLVGYSFDGELTIIEKNDNINLNDDVENE